MQRSFSKIFFLLFFLNSILNFAQKNNLSGVFLNAADFRSKRITYTEIYGKKYRFHPNNFLCTSFIKITIGDSVYKLKKDSVFGYRTKENKCYRVYRNEEYEIINPNEKILIYSKTFFTGYKTNQVTKYFFSIFSDADIYPLTKYNLKQATVGDLPLHDQLDIYFRNDEDLIEFDSFYNMYKINKVYQIK